MICFFFEQFLWATTHLEYRVIGSDNAFPVPHAGLGTLPALQNNILSLNGFLLPSY
jgi:hypothetical protein